MSKKPLSYLRRHHVALLALFVALGGTSYAAITITGKNVRNASLTGVDVKSSSLTGTDIRNRSLRGLDFRAGELPSGPKGDTGATGSTGAKGDPGGAGRSALENLRPGETIRGVSGFISTATAGGQLESDFVTLPAPAPVALDSRHVVVDGLDESEANECTGSYENPTADLGFVCVYPTNTANATSVAGFVPFSQPTRFGFAVLATTVAPGPIVLQGSWAYTAP